MTAKMKIPSSGGSFQDPEAGTFPAVCVRAIDLGTQEGEYNGKKTSKRQIMLQFELHGESVSSDASGYMADDYGKPDPSKPFLVSAWLTASFHEEATLRKYLESWRGRPYDDAEIAIYENEGFDWSLMLGVPCMVKMGKNSTGKMRIQGVEKLHKNVPTPKPVNDTFAFVMGEDFDAGAYNRLSDGIKEIIAKSPEFKQANGMGAQVPSPARAGDSGAPFDDAIPF